jgi:HD-GYP domain-containing protein (c-di-GMP phosphodiesterase class II)
VAALAIRLAGQIGLEGAEVTRVGLMGKLHDIGKVAIPDAILLKPGPLTDEEWALMKRHPVIGAEVISHVPTLRATAAGIRGHHERWDGRGYPDGLAGEAIPLAARIINVADSYSAMTTDRPYQSARNAEAALQEMKRCAGTQFDPAVVAALEQLMAGEAEETEHRQAA